MKFQDTFLLLATALPLAAFATMVACEGSDSSDPTPVTAAAAADRSAGDDSMGFRRERPARMGTDKRDALLARADAAYDEMESAGRVRSESRIGPQPWPDDLPARWPRPQRAQVLADTHQQQGDRLLLVDLPEAPDLALDRYRAALEKVGFEVIQPDTQRTRRALHARRGEDEAVLTFFGRERATRVEILFVGRGSNQGSG